MRLPHKGRSSRGGFPPSHRTVRAGPPSGCPSARPCRQAVSLALRHPATPFPCGLRLSFPPPVSALRCCPFWPPYQEGGPPSFPLPPVTRVHRPGVAHYYPVVCLLPPRRLFGSPWIAPPASPLTRPSQRASCSSYWAFLLSAGLPAGTRHPRFVFLRSRVCLRTLRTRLTATHCPSAGTSGWNLPGVQGT